ncbi:MAG: hypothetical protein IJU02_02745 [Lachnospiraceae bacterium]|nr:hypothetical protein [Lachnospiraceae bacterium]
MAYYEENPNNQQPETQGQPVQPEPQVQQAEQVQPEPQVQQAEQANQGQQFQQNQQANQGQQFQQNQQANQGQQFQQAGQQQYQQTSQGYNVVDAGHSPTQIMVFGIVSLCVSVIIGWTVIFGILSIVFGALAMSWSKKYMQANPNVDNGQVKAGRITGIIGFIFGIIDVVFGTITWISVGCVACLAPLGYM